ncbi:MAG TPA: hypothetical protein VG937_29995 [Polyangiaceae bacterium]|jgi:hypothetical protein|nr:hypothetical protein [Polyangiaceae bacterium]
MNKPIHPPIIDLRDVLRPKRIVEVDATGAQRTIEVLETTGETIADEPCRPLSNTNKVIPFAASLRRVG